MKCDETPVLGPWGWTSYFSLLTSYFSPFTLDKSP